MPLLTTSKLPSGRYTLQAAVNRCKSPLRLRWQNLQPRISPPALKHGKTQPATSSPRMSLETSMATRRRRPRRRRKRALSDSSPRSNSAGSL
uniref:Uncharacterized protein n=1 Tax=Rhipicephalus zambeziensis TaxID=60191 RepID=A0A224YI60_9ACAR